MKNKFLFLFLASIIVISVFSSVFAIDYDELIAKLGQIKTDIALMKAEYNDILVEYSDVIDSLSTVNKTNALTLADNLMAEDIKEKVNAIKDELKVLGTPGASEVLDAINDLEDDAKKLIDDNKDVVEEVKSGYQNLTLDEIKEVINEVNEISDSLGYDVDTTDTYNSLMTILNDAHTMGLAINDKLDTILTNHVNSFKEVVTLDLLNDMLDNIKAKDREALVDTLKDAINGASNASVIKLDLEDLKQALKALKNKLIQANDLDESAILNFSDAQKDAISNKAKIIENDYVDFAKLVLNNHSENYIHEFSLVFYDESVDLVIEYANKALDYVLEYKDTIKEIYNNKDYNRVINKLNIPTELKDVVKKASILIAIGFIDTPEYDLSYIENKFSNEIEDLADVVTDEVLDYLDYIDASMQKEISNEVKLNSTEVAQSNIRLINSGRYTTLENLKELKERVETEILSKTNKLNKVKKLVDKADPYVSNIYYINILDTIEKIMSLESEKTNKKYEYNSAYDYIITDTFMTKSDIIAELGIKESYVSDVVSYGNLKDNKVRTGSILTIEFSDTVYGEYLYAVLGDVYADGIINSKDYMAVKNHIMETDILTGIKLWAADTYRNGSINSQDYMKIKNYIMKDIKISL